MLLLTNGRRSPMAIRPQFICLVWSKGDYISIAAYKLLCSFRHMVAICISANRYVIWYLCTFGMISAGGNVRSFVRQKHIPRQHVTNINKIMLPPDAIITNGICPKLINCIFESDIVLHNILCITYLCTLCDCVTATAATKIEVCQQMAYE